MTDTLPALDHTPVRHEQQRPRGPLPYLAILVALALPADAYLQSWIRWTLVYRSTGLGVTYSMWSLIRQGIAVDMGAGWMMIVGVGMAVALAGTAIELVLRPVHTAPRWLALGGFGLAVLGLSLGLIVSVGGYNASSIMPYFSSTAFTTSLDAGFWLALVIALIGAALSLGLVSSPPNEPPVHLPFAPSPLGPPPGLLPPGFYPPSEDGWSEYAERGRIPPGYMPPNYGPAVVPMPGFITPAYMKRDFPAVDWEALANGEDEAEGSNGGRSGTATATGVTATATGETAPPGSDGQVSTSEAAPAKPRVGRLVVEEAGRRSVRTVKVGERLVVGRDHEVEIVVRDPKVSERHAVIEWRGDRWAIQDIDALNPTRLTDASGLHRLVRGETEIDAGQLAVGDVIITLYPMR